MKFKMNENSIFAVLLRSPWWASGLIAVGLFAAGRLALPETYGHYALFVALPFAGIAAYVGWRQMRLPGEARVSETMAALRALSWNDFSAALGEAYRREGHTVARCGAAGADFELTRAGRVSLVGCKRWKAAHTGIEPLREFAAALRERGAHEGIYVAAGDVSDPARAFAAEQRIRLVQAAELARLFPKGKS